MQTLRCVTPEELKAALANEQRTLACARLKAAARRRQSSLCAGVRQLASRGQQLLQALVLSTVLAQPWRG